MICVAHVCVFKCSQKNFVAIVDLPEGEHQYKFCVDGQWILDPTGVSGLSFFFKNVSPVQERNTNISRLKKQPVNILLYGGKRQELLRVQT